MSIVDVTKKLKDTAGPLFNISGVRLGYHNGGKQQLLHFAVSCSKPGKGYPTQHKMFILEGDANPVEEAFRIGTQLLNEVEEDVD